MNPIEHSKFQSISSLPPQKNNVYLIGASIFAYLFAQYASNLFESISRNLIAIIPIIGGASYIVAKILGLVVFYLICSKFLKFYLKEGKNYSSKSLFTKVLTWFVIVLVISRIYPIIDNILNMSNWYRSMVRTHNFSFSEIFGLLHYVRFLILGLLVNQFAEKWRVQNLE